MPRCAGTMKEARGAGREARTTELCDQRLAPRAPRLSCDRLHFLEPPHRALPPRRPPARALEPQLDQPLDQARVLDLCRLPQLRVHRDRGEAGDGVDLVDEEAVGAALEEEIDACEARGADRPERRDGQPPDLVRLVLRELR